MPEIVEAGQIHDLIGAGDGFAGAGAVGTARHPVVLMENSGNGQQADGRGRKPQRPDQDPEGAER